MTTNNQRSMQPWESSGTIFTQGAHALGLSRELCFVDVFSLEDTLPNGTLAVILVYPTPPNYEEQRQMSVEGHKIGAEEHEVPHAMWFQQRVQNACGPYALLHAVFNSTCYERLVPDSIFSRLEQQISRACSIDQRSSLLEADGELWAECAKIGNMGYSSLVEDPEADVEPHFVCFAGLDGQLAMFDGDRTSGPLVLHIPLGVGGLIPDQAKHAVMDHLNMYAGENRDFSTLLALVDNAIGNTQILPHHITEMPTTA